MSERREYKRTDPAPDQHLHTAGGMTEPASKGGRESEGADLASTDMSMDPPSNFGKVQPPEPYEGDTEPVAVPMEPDSSAARRLQTELDDLRDRHARLAAEFDNYRKRINKERFELGDRAQAEFVGKLLDVLDDMDRLTKGDHAESSLPALLEGLTLVDRKLWKTLESAGLERIDPQGAPFDPTIQEAVSVLPPPSPDQDHTVANTFQVGYRFKGNLVRPARVQVYSSEGHA